MLETPHPFTAINQAYDAFEKADLGSLLLRLSPIIGVAAAILPLIWLAGSFAFSHFKKYQIKRTNSTQVIHQEKILSEIHYSFPTRDRIKVRDLTKELHEYSRKLNLGKDGSYEQRIGNAIYFGPLRISTFFAFVGESKILLYRRQPKKGGRSINIKPIEIEGLDCFGAIDFANSSLVKKLPKELLDIEITRNSIEVIEGFAIEETKRHWLKFEEPSQAVMMMGFIVRLSDYHIEAASKRHTILTQGIKKGRASKPGHPIEVAINFSIGKLSTLIKPTLYLLPAWLRDSCRSSTMICKRRALFGFLSIIRKNKISRRAWLRAARSNIKYETHDCETHLFDHLNPDDAHLTAKARLAIHHLQQKDTQKKSSFTIVEKSSKNLLTDIDGCIFPIRCGSADTKILIDIKLFNPIFISGRSQPFIECLTNIMGNWRPFICENGSAIFDPGEKKYTWISPNAANLADRKSGVLKLLAAALPDLVIVTEPGKDFSISLSLIDAQGTTLDMALAHESVIAALGNMSGISVTHSNSAVDIIGAGVNKGSALLVLANQLGLKPSDFAGFGDSSNDLSFLSLVGFSGCPANANAAVKAAVTAAQGYCSPHQDIKGLLDFIQVAQSRP